MIWWHVIAVSTRAPPALDLVRDADSKDRLRSIVRFGPGPDRARYGGGGTPAVANFQMCTENNRGEGRWYAGPRACFKA
jgi:hypothetical protein